jgi:hypothetical protein
VKVQLVCEGGWKTIRHRSKSSPRNVLYVSCECTKSFVFFRAASKTVSVGGNPGS